MKRNCYCCTTCSNIFRVNINKCHTCCFVFSLFFRVWSVWNMQKNHFSARNLWTWQFWVTSFKLCWRTVINILLNQRYRHMLCIFHSIFNVHGLFVTSFSWFSINLSLTWQSQWSSLPFCCQFLYCTFFGIPPFYLKQQA